MIPKVPEEVINAVIEQLIENTYMSMPICKNCPVGDKTICRHFCRKAVEKYLLSQEKRRK